MKLLLFACFIAQCCAFGFEPVPLEELIKEADLVVRGKMELVREKGITITSRPERPGEETETIHYDSARIRSSGKALKSNTPRWIDEKIFPVLFPADWKKYSGFRDGDTGFWLLHWNEALGKFSMMTFKASEAEVREALRKIAR